MGTNKNKFVKVKTNSKMSSFLNADLGSDSSDDDEDFNPEKEVNEVSEEENSGDEEHVEGGGTKNKKRGKKKLEQQGWNMRLPTNENAKEEKEIKEAFEKEKEYLKVEAEKQKTLKTKSKPVSSTIASIFDTIDKQPTVTVDKTSQDELAATPSLMGSIFETVKNKPTNSQQQKDDGQKKREEDDNKIEITKVFDFAGDVVKDTVLVDKDSKEAQKYLKQQEEASTSLKRKPGGLNSIMGAISGKVTKMGTLDKSKRDWNEYVADAGIKEELQTHNKRKDGYVEKQMFLERSDLRRFEIEKAAREKTRKPLNR